VGLQAVWPAQIRFVPWPRGETRRKELDESAPAKVRNVQRTPNGLYFYLKTLSKDNTAKLYMSEGLAARRSCLWTRTGLLQPAGLLTQSTISRLPISPTTCRYAALLRYSEESSAINRLDPASLDVIITAIEHVAHFGHFAEISSHSVFHKFVGRATTLGSQFV